MSTVNLMFGWALFPASRNHSMHAVRLCYAHTAQALDRFHFCATALELSLDRGC